MARPTHFAVPASDTIRVRVTPEQRQDIRQIAQDNRVSVAEVIREAVNEYVADYRDRGVFAVQNAPSAEH